jgi:hypothetical protein
MKRIFSKGFVMPVLSYYSTFLVAGPTAHELVGAPSA